MQPLFKLQASQVCTRFYLPLESMLGRPPASACSGNEADILQVLEFFFFFFF